MLLIPESQQDCGANFNLSRFSTHRRAETVMPVAAQSDEPGSRLRPFRGARPPWRGQWTAGARRPPTVFVTAVKVPNDRMRGSQFSSCNISLTYRGYGRTHSVSEDRMAAAVAMLTAIFSHAANRSGLKAD